MGAIRKTDEIDDSTSKFAEEMRAWALLTPLEQRGNADDNQDEDKKAPHYRRRIDRGHHGCREKSYRQRA